MPCFSDTTRQANRQAAHVIMISDVLFISRPHGCGGVGVFRWILCSLGVKRQMCI